MALSKNILVTGGAGYIGSHVVVELVANGYRPFIVDNLSNSGVDAISNLEKLIGQPVTFFKANYQDAKKISRIIQDEKIDGVIHFAAYKYVGESVEQPLKYYKNNVASFVDLLEVLLKNNVINFVFSSSAAVYGNPPSEIVTEETPCSPTSPYGWSKYMDEIILRDTCVANSQLKGAALRYFNVVGSHDSAAIGESPKVQPQNLLPLITRAVTSSKPLTVFGADYPTPDGTCLRDYIHVVDLAKAHVAALNKMLANKLNGYRVFNISTGKPTSVFELIKTFEKENKVKVPYKIGNRRPGDPVAYYALADRAKEELSFQAKLNIQDAVRTAWKWHNVSQMENV